MECAGSPSSGSTERSSAAKRPGVARQRDGDVDRSGRGHAEGAERDHVVHRVEQPQLVELARLGGREPAQADGRPRAGGGQRRRALRAVVRGLDRREDDHAARRRPRRPVAAGEQEPGGDAEREQHGGERRRGQRAQRERPPPPRRALRPARGGLVARRQRRQGGQRRDLLPRRRLEALQARDDGRQPLGLGAQAGVRAQLGLEGGALLRAELAQQVAGEAVAAHRASSSSISSRRRASACTIRIFTVPSGMPVASAISRWLRPP